MPSPRTRSRRRLGACCGAARTQEVYAGASAYRADASTAAGARAAAPQAGRPTPGPRVHPVGGHGSVPGDGRRARGPPRGGGGRSHTGGRVPPGTYAIQVVFRPGDAPQNQGTLKLEAGESAIVNCKGSFYRCTIRGPWK